MADSTRKDFIEELKAMKQRMEELFMCNFDKAADEAQGQAQSEAAWLPSTDIVDTGKELVYMIDLPGVTDSDLQVECKADRLWVSGKRGEDMPRGDSILAERAKGAFSRIFKLPCAVRQDDIQAEFKKGVLRIVFPKELCSSSRTQKVVVRREE